MINGSFDIDGYTFGAGTAVSVLKLDPGEAGVRDQDVDSPTGDRRFFGRDHLSPPVWAFDLGVARTTEVDALAVLGVLAARWRTAASAKPGAESTLRYMVGNRVRRVYGRARRGAMDPNRTLYQGFVSVAGRFVTSDALHYADDLQTVELGLRPVSSGGVTLPAVWPLQSVRSAERQGFLADVGGDAPAPFLVTFTGPAVNPYASGDGWSVSLATTLAYDQSVTVDTRLNTVTRNDGANLAGALSRRSRLADARLHPGSTDIRFGAVDPTFTATCSLSWRSAFHGF